MKFYYLLISILLISIFLNLELSAQSNKFRKRMQVQPQATTHPDWPPATATRAASGGDWKQLPSFPDGRERAFSFVIGDKLYIGTGRSERSIPDFSINHADVWSYDFLTQIWQQVAGFDSLAFRNATGFSIGGYGYIIGGYDGTQYLDHVWRYDPVADQWDAQPPFPGGKISFAATFIIDNKAYLACGAAYPTFYNHLWEFDPASGVWTQKTDFPGLPRWRSFGFAIGGLGFVGGGSENGVTQYQDFYMYDPSQDTWSPLPGFPSPFSTGCFSFVINGKAYVGDGMDNGFFDQTNASTIFWSFDPSNVSWTLEGNFEGDLKGRVETFTTSYNGKGYVGGGRNWAPTGWIFFDDFWEFDPNAPQVPSVYTHWEEVGTGFSLDDPISVYGISIVDTSTIWGVTNSHNFSGNPQQFFRTIDGDQTWTNGVFGNIADDIFAQAICAIDDQTAFIAASNWQGGAHNMYKTRDGGQNWNTVSGPFAGSTSMDIWAIHFFDEREGVAMGVNWSDLKNAIFVTSDSGDTWISAPFLPSNLSSEFIDPRSGNGSYEAIEDTVWFGNYSGGRIWKSTNRGVNWTAYQAPASLENTSLSGIAFKNSKEGMVVGNTFFNEDSNLVGNRAAVTRDGGLSWTEIPIPQHPIAIAMEYVPGTNGTFIVNDGWFPSTKLILTRDFGQTWEIMDAQPNMDCMQLLDSTYGWAGGLFVNSDEKGLYKWTGERGPGVSIEEEEIGSALAFRIYPNPATSEIFIENPGSYEIQEVRVLNTLGQQVYFCENNLEDETLKVDLSKFSSGVYFVQLINAKGGLLQTKKVIVEK